MSPAADAFNPRWRWSNPRPHGGNVYDMAYGLGLTVQVAERGQLYTSEDLIYWELQYTGTDRALLAVVFFNERLIAAGERGTVLYADSLGDIRRVDLGTTDWLLGAAASANAAVLVGDNAALYYSSDGASWTRQSPPAGVSDWLRHVTYGKNTFVAVGENGVILTSVNGRVWKKETSGTTRHLNRIVWLNEVFYAVGEGGLLLSSSNGASWQMVGVAAVTNTLYAVTGTTNQLLVAGQGVVQWRRGNGPWTDEHATNKPAPAPRWTYHAGLHDGSLYFLAGRSGFMVEGLTTNENELVWLHRHDSPRNWLWDLCRVPDFYVAVGDQATLLTSADGISWTPEALPAGATNAILLGVAGNSNRLAVAGNRGLLLLSDGFYTNVVSTNQWGAAVTNRLNTLGIFWRELPARLTTNDLQAVALRGEELLVAGGNGVSFYSPDGGQQWFTNAAVTNVFLSGAAAFPGGWVLTGDRGMVQTSADGRAWMPRNSGVTNWLFRVRWLGDRLVAVGQNGTLLTSFDGVGWTAHTTGVSGWLNDVTRVGNLWYVVGNQGTVLASSNLQQWVNLGTLTQKSLFGAASHEGQLVVAGVEGAILRASIYPPLTPPQFLRFAVMPPTNGLSRRLFLIQGAPDQRVLVERSTDLQSWTNGPAFELIEPDGTLLFLDSAPRQEKEFFRARLQP